MNFQELFETINSLDFNEIVREETRQYFYENIDSSKYSDGGSSKQLLLNGQKLFSNNGDKIIFYVEAINYLNERIDWFETRIRYDFIKNYENKIESSDYSEYDIYEHEQYSDQKNLEKQKKCYEAQIFYSVRELEKLGIRELDKNVFSKDNVADLTKKINAILIKIDEITVGQEVIYDFIDELKNDFGQLQQEFPLGKKRWYQRYSGMLLEYASKKGAEAFFNFLKPELIKIVHDSDIIKFLH